MEWAALAAAAVGAIGGIIGQNKANKANQDLSQETRDWMEMMSNSAYQRATADMGKAGLNPMLAYSQGGASTPTASAPVMESALGKGVQGGVASAQAAIGVAQGIQQVKTGAAQSDNYEASSAEIESRTMEREVNAAEQIARIDKLRADKGLTQEQADKAKADAADAWSRYESNLGNNAGKLPRHSAYEIARRTSQAEERKRHGEAGVAHLLGRRSDTIDQAIDKSTPYLKNLFDNAKGGVSSAWQEYQDWRYRNAQGAR